MQPWNQLDLADFVRLDRLGETRFRSRYADPNLNGRAYGGQSIAHTMMAAALAAPAGRSVSSLSVLFLKGSDPASCVDYEVTPLQDGARFSARRINASQEGRGSTIEAFASFCKPMTGPDHSGTRSGALENPDDLEKIDVIPEGLMEQLRPLGPYSRHIKPSIDFRIPDIDRQLSPRTATHRLRFWIRTRKPLPDCEKVHAAAFAFLSDWWLNFSSFSGHVRELEGSVCYIASLNHAIWFHRKIAADQWMLVESESPCAANGRGLSIARVFDRTGSLVASVTQESLIAEMRS